MTRNMEMGELETVDMVISVVNSPIPLNDGVMILDIISTISEDKWVGFFDKDENKEKMLNLDGMEKGTRSRATVTAQSTMKVFLGTLEAL